MRTVYLNKQALAKVVGCLLFVLCLVAYFAADDSPRLPKHESSLLVRDAVIRKANVAQTNQKDVRLEMNRKLEREEMQKGGGEEKSADVSLLQNDVPSKNLIGKRQYVDTDDENDKRRQKVKEMMLHAWNGYKMFAWGKNEVKPIAKKPNQQGIFGGYDMPATIVDAADTLFLMDLNVEYVEARDYIRENFTMTKATSALSVFEATIRYLGGLLSLYALTGERFYLEKSREVGEALLPAFNTPSGIPKSTIDVQRKYASNYGWANGGSSILTEVGSLHLEFLYLSRAAKLPIFEKKVRKARDVLDKAEKPDGLYPNYISAETGRFVPTFHMSLGALGDSFYEYLMKSWLQTGKVDTQAKRMYWDVSENLVKKMIKTSTKSKLVHTVELRGNIVEDKMSHLACFCVGMFALQAANEPTPEKKNETMTLAEELGRTCHESYIRTTTRIGPEIFYFNDKEEATTTNDVSYILRPEVIEGYFYLWRLTGKEMYREWVWDATQAIDKHCRVEHGFVGLVNVNDPSRGFDDVQQSFFLAETLKYAYLTFADNSLLDLEKWVFNTEAHPLPVLTS